MRACILFFSAFLCVFLCAAPASLAQQQRGIVVGDYLSPSDIEVLKSWNVKLVRYTFLWPDIEASDNATSESYRAWLNEEFTQFDPILANLEAAGIKVALNLFTPPGGFSDRGSRAAHRLFEQRWAQDEFVLAWQTIVTRYKGRAGIYGFDLLNEPAEATRPIAPLLDWNGLAQKTAEAIRLIDPTTPIIMTPVYGKMTRFKRMKPLTVPTVYYTIHYYTPWRFIHQGIYGVKMGLPYPTAKDNRRSILKDLSVANRFAKKHKTRIYVGEFTVARWAPRGSGARYLRDLVGVFERFKFDWTYHSFRGSDIWDLELSDTRGDLTKPAVPSKRFQVILGGFARNSR